MSQGAVSMVLNLNSSDLGALMEKYLDEDGDWWRAKQRGRRAISQSDMQAILDLHNKLRGQVYPQASNMEHMVNAFQYYSLFVLAGVLEGNNVVR